MSRSGGQSEVRPPVFKSPSKLGTHRPTAWYWARTRDKASHDPIPIPLGYRGRFKLGKTSKEIYAILVRVYEDQTLSIEYAYEWFTRFREGGECVTGNSRNGRQAISVSDENIEKCYSQQKSDTGRWWTPAPPACHPRKDKEAKGKKEKKIQAKLKRILPPGCTPRARWQLEAVRHLCTCGGTSSDTSCPSINMDVGA
ncbi:hypothetical protein TNCV_4649311 [Trichonephila clavipes]|uniref:Mos1 transposase HTH domain-containing protein n=1 Tax=Trichonephila clavipes TaxID=2585209 RepID=A0A8X6VN49_TRICX|nr:hypothetical protein TNCV_4649311 [Trichonephila clavipes]